MTELHFEPAVLSAVEKLTDVQKALLLDAYASLQGMALPLNDETADTVRELVALKIARMPRNLGGFQTPPTLNNVGVWSRIYLLNHSSTVEG